MGRVVNVSSCAHAGGSVPTKAQVMGHEPLSLGLDPENMQLYFNTKLCNILHARFLNIQFQTERANVRVNSVHPGIVMQSDIWRNDKKLKLGMGLISATCKSAEQGAASIVWAATADDLEGLGGCHVVDCNVSDSHPKGHNMEAARQLFLLSENLLDMVLGTSRDAGANRDMHRLHEIGDD
mmetsp:Transcript_37138/g.69783  ORF Transcript_37138/g.69783 Transcript_37138/m.69783 type:complete len:181 (+) Transcript_37138:210-752(+)